MIEGKLDAAEDSAFLELLSESPRARVELIYQKSSKRRAVRKTLYQADACLYLSLLETPILGIPKIYAVIPQQEACVIVEEWIEGCTLLDTLNQSGTQDERTVLNWMMQLCCILQQIHARGIIHRDIKPSNLMISPNGRLFLIDFDSARIFQPSKEEDTVCLGTKGYAAPEQFGFAQTDGRTDLYSMGVVFRQAMSPALMGCSRLAAVIERCTPLDPNQRYQSAGQVLADLRQLMAPAVLSIPEQASLRRQSQAGKIAGFGFTLLFLALLAVGVFSNSKFPLISDKILIALELILVSLPPLAFCTNLFQVRTRPILACFRPKGMKKWYFALYFFCWYILGLFVTALLRNLLSPAAQSIR